MSRSNEIHDLAKACTDAASEFPGSSGVKYQTAWSIAGMLLKGMSLLAKAMEDAEDRKA